MAAVAGMACLTSYLFLFLSFYARTYKKPAKKVEGANGNGVANGRSNGKKK